MSFMHHVGCRFEKFAALTDRATVSAYETIPVTRSHIYDYGRRNLVGPLSVPPHVKRGRQQAPPQNHSRLCAYAGF